MKPYDIFYFERIKRTKIKKIGKLINIIIDSKDQILGLVLIENKRIISIPIEDIEIQN